MILSFRTDMPGQTVQTQIRLFLEEQSDQGLHCLPFRLHRLDSLLYMVEPHSSNFRVITTIQKCMAQSAWMHCKEKKQSACGKVRLAFKITEIYFQEKLPCNFLVKNGNY